MLKTLIVDDERLARVELMNLLSAFPEIEVVGQASNADEAIELVDSLKPQLVFLDINMPEKSGFELLEDLVDAPFIVFTTAYDEFALRAFEVNAQDYLLKPVKPERLKEAIEKVKKLVENQNNSDERKNLTDDDQVFIRDGDKCYFIKVGDICKIDSVGNYARLHFNGQEALVHKSLNAMNQRLDNRFFFRANRQEIINLKYIDRIEPYFSNSLLVYLKTGHRIEVSRRQAIRFKDVFSL